MTDGESTGTAGDAGERPVVYCLIPPELAPKLHDLLRDHFRDEPRVEVIVDRRHRERRRGEDRRAAEAKAPPEGERRRVRSATGRRVGERRAPLVPTEALPLPRRARRYADRIRFVERLEPATERAEDLDSGRLVTRFQAGDEEAFSILYARYFGRIYGYLRIALRDAHEAEDATQQVFVKALESLADFELRRRPFRAWLFVIARNTAVSVLRKQSRSELMDPSELSLRAERATEPDQEPQLSAIDWISDRDLLLFVERLPESQQQVLVLRYMLDLTAREVAEILGRSENEVRMLQHRAQRFLRERLIALGRDPKSTERSKWQARRRQAIVVRERRFVLRP